MRRQTDLSCFFFIQYKFWTWKPWDWVRDFVVRDRQLATSASLRRILKVNPTWLTPLIAHGGNILWKYVVWSGVLKAIFHGIRRHYTVQHYKPKQTKFLHTARRNEDTHGTNSHCFCKFLTQVQACSTVLCPEQKNSHVIRGCKIYLKI
jgi:hypothetical protein